MNVVNLTDETLVAYVDDQLDAQTRTEVEAALANDTAAQETVRQLRESARLAHAACDEALHWEIPPRMLEALENKSEPSAAVTDLGSRRSAQRRTLNRAWALPLAASVALTIGFGSGYAIWGGFAPESDAVNFVGTIPINTPLHQVLETAPSGQTVAWEDPEQQLSREIKPLLTFRDGAERYCREYQIVETASGQSRGTVGVACRDVPERRWNSEISITMHVPAEGAYQPAGAGHVALEAYINELMADAPLDPSSESSLIDGGWR